MCLFPAGHAAVHLVSLGCRSGQTEGQWSLFPVWLLQAHDAMQSLNCTGLGYGTRKQHLGASLRLAGMGSKPPMHANTMHDAVRQNLDLVGQMRFVGVCVTIQQR
jgi:hypothetical protein